MVFDIANQEQSGQKVVLPIKIKKTVKTKKHSTKESLKKKKIEPILPKEKKLKPKSISERKIISDIIGFNSNIKYSTSQPNIFSDIIKKKVKKQLNSPAKS